jgi:hypothetical protein
VNQEGRSVEVLDQMLVSQLLLQRIGDEPKRHGPVRIVSDQELLLLHLPQPVTNCGNSPGFGIQYNSEEVYQLPSAHNRSGRSLPATL